MRLRGRVRRCIVAAFDRMLPISQTKICVILFIVAACLTGCATQSFDPDKAPEFLVQSDYAPFYSLGPGQERGPDASLQRGERVKILRREFGFSYVEIKDGRTGYIANEEITPAPKPEPKASPSPLHKRSRGASAGNSNVSESFAPMPDFENLPEPVDVLHPISEIETPADSKPEFRY